MGITPIGLNFSVFNNLSIDFNLTSNPVELIRQIPERANEMGQGYLGFILVGVLVLIVYLTLSNKSQEGDFQYDDVRSATIASAVGAIIGANEVMLGYIYNYTFVAFFTVIFLIGFIFILIAENKE